MSYWLLIALIPPILYTTSHYLDKILLDRLPGRAPGGIVLFSCFFSIIILPAILLFSQANVLSVSTPLILIALVSGAITVLSLIGYLEALFNDEVSYVAPLLQLIPVFGFLFGYLFLGETLSLLQILGGSIIILGSMILSARKGFSLRGIHTRTLTYMLVSTFFFALSGTLFKYAASSAGYWPIQFWEYVGILLIGICIFLWYTPYRDVFMTFFIDRIKMKFSLATVTEFFYVSGDLVLNFATLLAPLALVYTVNSIQPLFIFIGALVMYQFFRKHSKETLHGMILVQKIVATVCIVLGGALLYL